MTPADQGQPAGNQTDPASMQRALSIGAVLAAITLVVLDGGATNVALQSIAMSLHVEPSAAILIVTSYQIAVVMALLPCAALGERFGLRRVFAVGVLLFAAAALASTMAPSLHWLMLARFVQGLGAAAILALGVALLRHTVSEASFGSVIGWNALTVALSAAAAPALGALALSQASWQWLYATEILLGLAVLTAARSLPFVAPNRERRFDGLSAGLSVGVFGPLVLAGNLLMSTPLIALALMLTSGAALWALVVRETDSPLPLVPLDLLRSATIRNAILASITGFTGQSAGLIALPFYLQLGLGLSAVAASLCMMVWPLSVALTAIVTNRVMMLAPGRLVCATGAALLGAGLLGLALWPANGDVITLLPFMAISGAGFGLFQVANNRSMFLAAPLARSGAAGGMQGTARLLGQTAGATLAAQLFALVPMASAPQVAMGLGGLCALTAGVISAFRTDKP